MKLDAENIVHVRAGENLTGRALHGHVIVHGEPDGEWVLNMLQPRLAPGAALQFTHRNAPQHESAAERPAGPIRRRMARFLSDEHDATVNVGAVITVLSIVVVAATVAAGIIVLLHALGLVR